MCCKLFEQGDQSGLATLTWTPAHGSKLGSRLRWTAIFKLGEKTHDAKVLALIR